MSQKRFVIGLALGALAGIVLGYLLSGKKVTQMPDDFKKMKEKLMEEGASENQNSAAENANNS